MVKIKTIDDILTPEEMARYREGWNNFKDKYELNNSYNVHSGIPVISQVFQFENMPIFRAHVFSKRLRRHDPYFIADKCIQPFWHAQHYLIVGEQMYSSCSKILIGSDYNQKVAKDVPIEFRWKKPLFWNENISVELIISLLGQVGSYEKQIGHFTFYSDKTGRILSSMSAESYWQQRAYVQDINRINAGDLSVIDALMRKIERYDINHRRLRNPRRDIKSNKEILIASLKRGVLLEQELHDFFSLWDKS